MKEFINKLLIALVVTIILIILSKYIKNPSIYHYLSLLLLIFVLFILLPWILNTSKVIKIHLSKCFYPKIGILNGNIKSPVREYKCERVWTSITTSMWLSEITKSLKSKWFKNIKLVYVSDINQSYSMIINPFGDNFPEEDLKLHTTFYKICDYISKGGYFICTGGSFYAHQNPIHSDKAEQIIIRTINGVQSLQDSFFYKEFGVSTTGDNTPNEKLLIDVYQNETDKKYIDLNLLKTAKVKRFRAAIKSTSDFIPILREINDVSFPVIAVRYGKGYLVHFGLLLESPTSSEYEIILKIIKYIIDHKFSKF